jgi:hypothetical protein
LGNLNFTTWQIWLKYSMLLASIFVLLSCQTPLKIAGSEHKLVAAKWYALSAYAESEIVDYGVTVSARFNVIREDDKEIFKIEGIKFSPYANERQLDLLNPFFEQKYICLPQCYQLLEYVNFNGKTSGSMLANFFEQHEFELFQFYGDLVVLSDKLKQLSNNNPTFIRSYLRFLAESNQEFDSTKSFIQFLEEALSENAIQQFVDNPGLGISDYLRKYQISADSRWSVHDISEAIESVTELKSPESEGLFPEQLWTEQEGLSSERLWTESEGLFPEQLWTEPEGLSPERLWTESEGAFLEQLWTESEELLPEQQLTVLEQLLPEQQWAMAEPFQIESRWLVTEDDSPDMILFTSRSDNDNLYTWEDAKILPIVVGQNACSYEENLFGIVTAITNATVIVKLLGQVKVLSEGIILELPSGGMFTPSDSLFFLPRTESMVFDKKDIAACYLE